jgi:predicted aspartyl protease
MRRAWFASVLTIATMLLGQMTLAGSVSAEPNLFNDPSMQTAWERTDQPVEMSVSQRSYMWGPTSLPGSPSTEPYADSPIGNRMVQYFDKARMEVNNANGDRSNPFFVTNGLLVREMVSGQVQLGDTQFQDKGSADEAVAGDPASRGNGDSPTYATFHNIASLNNDHPSPDRTGQAVVEAIDKSGSVSSITSPDPSVSYSQFDPGLKHNVANKFVDFLNQTGPVFVNGSIQQGQTVVNGLFLAGLPITEAYWVKAKVAGATQDVLVQLFERRVLTYTPANPPEFQVEMGNVGQHYLRWRYGADGGNFEPGELQVPLQVAQGPNGATLALVPIFIDGQGPFNFALDTGASNSLIDSSLAQQLGLPVVGTAGQVTGVTGAANAQLVNVDVWSVGNVHLPSLTAVSLPLPAANSGPGLVGLLGSDVLSTFGTVDVDYGRQVLFLREAEPTLEPGEIEVPLQIARGPNGATLALVPVSINGQGPFSFALDTGASNSLVDSALVQQLGITIIGPAGQVTGVTGSETALAIQLNQWSIGTVALPATTGISLSLAQDSSGPILAGLLGSDVLSTFSAIAVDYNQQRLILREKD